MDSVPTTVPQLAESSSLAAVAFPPHNEDPVAGGHHDSSLSPRLLAPAVKALPPQPPPVPKAATPFVAKAPVKNKVTKMIVPLSSPQGYNAAKQQLTLGVWQALGVGYDPADDSPAIAQVHGAPAPGLMHKAHPASDSGVVMGLAAYPNNIMGKLERFVGTLRFTGYQGHIILGVHPTISAQERR